MADFPPTTAELFETFEDLPDWEERYDFIIDLGRELPTLPAEVQTDEHIVEGCMSSVWLSAVAESAATPMVIQADSDSIIIKGLIVVMLAFYQGMTPAEIRAADISEYLSQLGLNQHLSPQRRNGLFSMIKRLNELAAEYA